MKLTFDKFDGRRFSYKKIIDGDTGDQVGRIRAQGSFEGGGIEVSLFDDTYQIMVNRYEEAWGFVKGVEVVLNRMIPTKSKPAIKAA
jgi:hypothetical protein